MRRSIISVVCSLALLQLGTVAADAAERISSDRAWHLAARYYHRYVSGCGGVGSVVPQDPYWLAPVHFGYAGTFSGYIRVHRLSGTVSYSGHPTVSADSLDAWFASVTKPRKHLNQAMQRTAGRAAF